MKASFLGWALASVLSGFGLVQQTPTDLKPLEVSNVAVERDSSGVPSMLRFNLTNKSSKSVDAYVVQIDYLDASKQMRTQSTRLSGRGVLPAGGKLPGFAPGETWSAQFSFHRVVGPK